MDISPVHKHSPPCLSFSSMRHMLSSGVFLEDPTTFLPKRSLSQETGGTISSRRIVQSRGLVVSPYKALSMSHRWSLSAKLSLRKTEGISIATKTYVSLFEEHWEKRCEYQWRHKSIFVDRSQSHHSSHLIGIRTSCIQLLIRIITLGVIAAQHRPWSVFARSWFDHMDYFARKNFQVQTRGWDICWIWDLVNCCTAFLTLTSWWYSVSIGGRQASRLFQTSWWLIVRDTMGFLLIQTMKLPQLTFQRSFDRESIGDARKPQGLVIRCGIQLCHLLLDVLGNVVMNLSQCSLTRHEWGHRAWATFPVVGRLLLLPTSRLQVRLTARRRCLSLSRCVVCPCAMTSFHHRYRWHSQSQRSFAGVVEPQSGTPWGRENCEGPHHQLT